MGKQLGFGRFTRPDENYGLKAGAAICRSNVLAAPKCLDTTREFR
jgi:hypothetical protein